jgi:hypothetical protein
MPMSERYDLISVGGGLGGFVAALRAHALGLRPLILEKTDLLGGVAAYSGGSVWIANNHLAQADGLDDTPEDAAAYLDFLGDGKSVHDASLRGALLETGAKAIRFLHEEIGIPFTVAGQPDSGYPQGTGSKRAGRMLEVAFNGADLGRYQSQLRRSPYYPKPGLRLREIERGGSMKGALELVAPEIEERRRVDFLARGGGLMASLIHAALIEREIECKTNARVVDLITEDGCVVGVRYEADGATAEARGNVMLATGAYGYAPWAAMMEGFPGFSDQAPPVGEGDAIVLASRASAAVVRAGNAFSTVGFMSSRVHPGTRTPMHLPLIGAVGAPYSMVVNSTGARFADESSPGLTGAFRGTGGYGGVQFRNWPAFFICDDRFKELHPIMGSGDVWPAEDFASAPDIGGLARRLGIDAAGLEATIGRFNSFARAGKDDDFARGTGGHAWRAGNPEPGHNTSLGTLEVAPFWGVRIQILGAGMCSHGLRIDELGRVLDWRAEPIPGLFATGNAVAFTDVPFGYQDGLANGRNITYAYLGTTTLAESLQHRSLLDTVR